MGVRPRNIGTGRIENGVKECYRLVTLVGDAAGSRVRMLTLTRGVLRVCEYFWWRHRDGGVYEVQ
jgi:hypothetical protein